MQCVSCYSQHPFLVELKYSFQTSGKLYLILEYMPGGVCSVPASTLFYSEFYLYLLTSLTVLLLPWSMSCLMAGRPAGRPVRRPHYSITRKHLREQCSLSYLFINTVLLLLYYVTVSREHDLSRSNSVPCRAVPSGDPL